MFSLSFIFLTFYIVWSIFKIHNNVTSLPISFIWALLESVFICVIMKVYDVGNKIVYRILTGRLR